MEHAEQDRDSASTMTDIGHHLNDSEYANWVKNTLALKITLDILKPYVDKELTNIQASITEGFPPGAACSSCNVYIASDCPNNVCNVFKNAIIENHRTAEPSFRNTNAKKWNTDAWEIAKCFMPSMTGYRDCTQSDADFSSIINVIINCKHFDALVTCDLNQDRNMFCEAKDMRNMLMHSGSLKVSEANLQKNLDLLVGLLSCFNNTPPNTNEALEQIQKLQTGELQISLDDVLYARKHVVLAIVEEFDQGKEKIQEFLNLCMEKLTHEIKTSSSIWKAQQHRLISNFIKGCKHSLIRLVESESESVKPKRYPEHKWNFKKFLNRIELFQDVESLLDRHKRLLYPEDGSTSDISKWDIFLLCHILSIETRVHLPNHLVNYVRELKALRDKILDDLDSIEEEDLEMLSGFLDEPLRTEIKSIYSRSDTTDDALQLLTVLKSWQANEDNMECKQIGTKALEQTKIQAIRIDEVENKQSEDRAEIAKLREEIGTIKAQNAGTQKQLHELSQKFEKLSGESKGEGNGNIIEASVEIRPRNCDPEQAELIQNNITSEDVEENVSLANDGLNQFQKQMNLDTVKTVKGSIILRVTCRSIKELIRFWDNCMDGSAVEALSKVRDDYRRLLGCDTLDFDIVLTKKEVHRCMNHLVHRMSSQALDETILKEIKDKVAMLQTFQAEREDLAEERKLLDTEVMMQAMEVALSEETMRRSQDEHMKPATVEDSSEEIGKSSLDEDVWPGKGKDISKEAPWLSLLANMERAEEHSFRACGPERVNKDSQPGPPSKLPLRKDLKHGDEEATRLAKFLRQMAESFEEGSISVVKPYLYELTKHSREKNQKAFDESVIRFTEATSFKGGISVSLIKQVHRGFHMILDEPEFGDLVVAKVEAIEKEEKSIAGEMRGVRKSSWPTDVKSTVIIAEDIQVVETKTSKSQSDPKLDIKRSFETESSKEKQPEYTKIFSGDSKGYGPEPSKRDEYTSKSITPPPIEKDVPKAGQSESS